MQLRGILVAVAVSMAWLGGCGGSRLVEVTNFTRSVDYGPRVAGEAAATLVIGRVDRGSPSMVTLMDAEGNVLGQLGLGAWMRVPLAPGRHRIYMMFANSTAWCSAIEVDVAPGRVYYASVTRMIGFWVAAPRHPDRFDTRDQWIRAGQEVEFDRARQAALDAEIPLAVRLEGIANANEAFGNLSERQLTDYVLRPEDGVTE